MPRVLLPIPLDQIESGAPIDTSYPKPYRPEDMRRWARDAMDMERARATGRPSEGRDAHRLEASHRALMGDPANAIRLDLVPGRSTLTIDNGRHRVHYAREAGLDHVPAWVSCPDPEALRRFEAATLAQARERNPDLVAAYRTQSRDDRDRAPSDTRGR